MRPTRPGEQRQENLDEPAEIRGLTKKKLYQLMSERFHLPGCESRGVTRDWLVGIYRNVNYGVPLLEFKHFYADLSPADLKKVPVLYCGPLLAKLNNLLRETGRPSLGFAQGVIPEEDWLISVIRFVDKNNVLGVFFNAIQGAPQIACDTQRMIEAKKNAETFLFRAGDRNLLNDKKLFKGIEGIYDQSKRIAGHRQELQLLVEQGRALEAKLQQEEVQLGHMLYNTAVAVHTQGNQINDFGDIFVEGNDVGAQHRESLQEILRLLKFIYISDASTDRSENAMALCLRFQHPPDQPENQ